MQKLPPIGSTIRVKTDWEDFLKSARYYRPRYEYNEGVVTEHSEDGTYFWLKPFGVVDPRVYNHIPMITMSRVVSIDYINKKGDITSTVDLPVVPPKDKRVRTWDVPSRSGDKKYNVTRYPSGKITCNCYAGLMNRNCWHAKLISDLVAKEKGD